MAGIYYSLGLSVPEDRVRAKGWFQKATSKRHSLAKLQLEELEWKEKQCA